MKEEVLEYCWGFFSSQKQEHFVTELSLVVWLNNNSWLWRKGEFCLTGFRLVYRVNCTQQVQSSQSWLNHEIRGIPVSWFHKSWLQWRHFWYCVQGSIINCWNVPLQICSVNYRSAWTSVKVHSHICWLLNMFLYQWGGQQPSCFSRQSASWTLNAFISITKCNTWPLPHMLRTNRGQHFTSTTGSIQSEIYSLQLLTNSQLLTNGRARIRTNSTILHVWCRHSLR